MDIDDVISAVVEETDEDLSAAGVSATALTSAEVMMPPVSPVTESRAAIAGLEAAYTQLAADADVLANDALLAQGKFSAAERRKSTLTT